MPANVREVMKSGFSHLGTLPRESLAIIAGQVIAWLDPSEPAPEIGTLARECNVDVSAMDAIQAAVTFEVSLLFNPKHQVSLPTFISKATTSVILDRNDASAVQAFSETHLQPLGAALSDALARAGSSLQHVPSFDRLETTIDLRVAAVDGHRVVTVPVVIATLRTDVNDRELLFQMTRRDVVELMKQLEEIAERLTQSKDMAIHFPSQE